MREGGGRDQRLQADTQDQDLQASLAQVLSLGKGESRGSLAYTSMGMQHAVGDGADDDSDDDLTLWQYLGKALWQKRKQDEEDTSMYDIMRKRD